MEISKHITEIKPLEGLRLLSLPTGLKEVVLIGGSILGGSVYSPSRNPFIATVTARMLEESTKRHKKEEIRKKLESVGATASFSSDTYRVRFNGMCLKKDVSLLLEIISEQIREPLFDTLELENIKKRMVAGLEDISSGDLYIANNHRSKDPQESLRRIIKSVESIDAKALKFKIGGRMKVIDEVPNRTEKLIPMVAKALGDRCTLYADANSSYLSVQKAIEVGKILEANGIAFYEEPVPFDYLDETKRVAEALNIPIAWGEQESSQWRFKWMVENSGVRIFQPDIFYYGGLIRSLRVAQMAAAKGFDCTPHISGGGLGFLYMGIYAACCPNPGPYQEYKGLTDDFPWESTGDKITVKNGSMTAPNGHGIGVDIDPDYLANVDRVK